MESNENKTTESNVIENSQDISNQKEKITVKESEDGKWIVRKSGDAYTFAEKFEDAIVPLKTRKGFQVETTNEELADKVLEDIQKYGNDFYIIESSLGWFSLLLDEVNLRNRGRMLEEIAEIIGEKQDWTLDAGVKFNDWRHYFGKGDERRSRIMSWLGKCTNNQLAAALAVSIGLGSWNVGFALAAIAENYDGLAFAGEVLALGQMIADICEPIELWQYHAMAQNFQHFYVPDMEANGPITGVDLKTVEEPEERPGVKGFLANVRTKLLRRGA